MLCRSKTLRILRRILSRKKVINLALQGGGAHGAFTWGVLDRFLDDPRIEIEGISAASSGAMNAAIFAYGMSLGGRDAARELLERFWKSVANKVDFTVPGAPLPRQTNSHDISPWLNAYIELSRIFSPYLMNPLGINPLRDILNELIDFEHLRHRCKIKLFIASTRVRSGKIAIFRNEALSKEVLLASACVPSIHHAVNIDGEPHWDGGLSGNPAVFPLIFNCRHKDIVIVTLQPLMRPQTPTTGKAIWERMTEFAFNATFLREMRAIADLKLQAQDSAFAFGHIDRKFRRLKLHLIEGGEVMAQLSHLSRFNARLSFLQSLRAKGREYADDWLAETYQKIGTLSTFDVASQFY